MLKLDQERLMQILKNFYTITGLNTAVYNTNLEEIAYYPGNLAFCDFISKSPASSICITRNSDACKACKESREGMIYKCDFGLWDTVTPLTYRERIIGYIMAGQARETDFDNAGISEIIGEYKFDGRTLKELYQKLPLVDKEFIRASTEILRLCIEHLYSLNIISDKVSTFVQHIDDYISEHLQDDLSVACLNKVFYISKAHLYRLFQANYGMSASQYILKRRLARAKELLADGTMSLNQIAQSVGIPDYNYFTKVFTKHVGISPNKFKKKNIGEIPAEKTVPSGEGAV